MAALLTLPRELRDQIYAYILISPSPVPLIEALPYRSTSTSSSSSSSRYKICLNPPSPCTNSSTNPNAKANLNPTPKTKTKRRGNKTANPKLILTSLSLRRTCRQIHHETHGLLWTHNTLLFSRIDAPDTGVVRILKSMGQATSRQIRCIRLLMPAPQHQGACYAALPRIMTMLASRARHGAFQRLEVVWGREEWVRFVVGEVGAGGRLQERVYVGMMEGLGRGSENRGGRGGFDRVMWVPVIGGEGGRERALVREMLCAFGGRVWWGERCIEDWREV